MRFSTCPYVDPMKTLFPLFLFLSASALIAQTPTSTASPASSDSKARDTADLAAIERFLDLSDAELAQTAEAIARVRAMTPAQRAELRKEIAAFRQLPEPQRQQLRQGWGWMPPEIQEGWREMMQNATPAERASIQAKMQALPPPEKMKYRRELVEAYLKSHPRK